MGPRSIWAYRHVSIAIVFTCFALLATWGRRSSTIVARLSHLNSPEPTAWTTPERLTLFRDSIVPCRGPDGFHLNSNIDDQVRSVAFNDAPQPYAGSYAELGLSQSWATAIDRYGAYGFSDSSVVGQSKVEWAKVDWADLQNECLLLNLRPGSNMDSSALLSASRKMSLPPKRDGSGLTEAGVSPLRQRVTTGRTAIVLRGYSTYVFKAEDFWNIRALIAETSLRFGGRYTVILLVDVKGNYDVMHNSEEYESVLNTIPNEFRNMTVLFDQKHFLRSWYPLVGENRPGFQIEQARQLFAQHFPEYDHFWQLEMDVRFTGDAGRFLHALETFARKEPRKQARERLSYFFTPTFGTYANFTSLVNSTLDGDSTFWRGIPIPEVAPIAEPPVKSAKDDNFTWGVGDEADLILLSGNNNVTLALYWSFRDWIRGFKNGLATPRVTSAPAVNRASWNLLNAVHEAQSRHGLAVPSEATLPSFALWHNLKLSRPPCPLYGQFAHRYSQAQIDLYLNGGPPSSERNGMAYGTPAYGKKLAPKSVVNDLGPTFRWKPGYPKELMDAWLKGDADRVRREGSDVPTLYEEGGNVYMPAMMLHPVKSNPNPPANLLV